ncbi:hypothetical protein [Streptococcus hyointestinalis]|nr:hypothetical protein [Streptococcus hyointestinalis]
MSVTLITNYYSDICDSYNYGRQFLELPEAIIDAVNDYFDGQTVDLNGNGNPDNMWVNHYYPMGYRDALVNFTKMLTHEEYTQLAETGQVDSYIEKHFDEIEERLNENCYLLGYAGNCWHVFV